MIEAQTCAIIAGLAALVALLVGYAAARLRDHFRHDNARARAAEVIDQAKKEADNLQRGAELKAKEDLFKRREELEREIDVKRAEVQDQLRKVEESRLEVRDEEKRLGKREDVLLKKERSLEHS